MNWHLVTLTFPLVLAACASVHPVSDFSTRDKMEREMAWLAATQSAEQPTPSLPSPKVTPTGAEVLQDWVMPSLQSGLPRSGLVQAEPRFDFVVTDAPMAQVLTSLAMGSTYNLLLKPHGMPVPAGVADSAGQGALVLPTVAMPAQASPPPADMRVSLSLKNTSLFEVLDALRDVYGYDYSIDKNKILVQPAQLQTRLFHINYILGQRRGVSDLQVVGGASIGRSAGTSTNSITSNFASVQASGLSTTVKADFWTELEDALRTVLSCNIPRASSGAAVRSPTAPTNSLRADISHPSDVTATDRMRGVDGCSQGRALTINPMSGTLLARGMPSELRMVAQLIQSMQLSITRQVIIESKIIDVELNKDAQQGINWALFQKGLSQFTVGANANNLGVNQPSAVAGSSGGTVANTVSLGSLLGGSVAPGSAIASGAGIAIQSQNFAALINFLESQGRVHVLSSPRIATLNNQKAILKVGSEEPFVTNISGGISTVTGTTTVETKPSLVYQPFFSGISLDVTPQIDAEDNITLHVHSMVNNVMEKSKIALPDSGTLVPFAVNIINETDSVVKAKDGQVIVIGGLMTERNADVRNGVPGARDLPWVGGLFNWGTQSVVKRELVILLKSTVVKDDSAWARELSATHERMRTAR